MRNSGLFQSFFSGGFECSTHRLHNGRRLDMVGATRHQEFAAEDYRLLQAHELRTARDGLRWHLIETAPGRYDFSSAEPMLKAARDTGMQVIWDLWHYGWPDDIDIFSGEFARRFVHYARAAAELVSQYDPRPCLSPFNEISFFVWAAGDAGFFHPFLHGRGAELKRQLARATILAVRAMREINPAIRFFQMEPIIHVIPADDDPQHIRDAEMYRQSQYEVWDMIAGRRDTDLDGSEDLLDVIGANYYINNQWVHATGPVVPSDPRYRHVGEMLAELHARYQKPVFISETGIEDEARPEWLRYMSREVCAALQAGVPVEGLCLYPVLNHPGWDDNRHCRNGLFDYADDAGRREIYEPLAAELQRQQSLVEAVLGGRELPPDAWQGAEAKLDWATRRAEELNREVRHE